MHTIIKNKNPALLLRGLLITLLLGAASLTSQISIAEELPECAALKDPIFYEKNGYDAYSLLIKGKNGWLFRTREDLKYRFKLEPQTALSLKKLNLTLQEKGTELIIAMLPPRGLTRTDKLPEPWDEDYDKKEALENFRRYVHAIEATGIKVATSQNPHEQKDFYYKTDNHWTVSGANTVARAVANHILSHPAYQNLRNTRYETSAINLSEHTEIKALHPDRYRKTYFEICDVPYSRSTLPIMFETLPVQEGNMLSENDLFGDLPVPEIILLGTSNSTNPRPSYANFEGQLKQALSADIYNGSITGGGLIEAISEYISSEKFKTDKPKFIIWEISAYYGLNDTAFINELILALGKEPPIAPLLEEPEATKENTEDKDFQTGYINALLSFFKRDSLEIQTIEKPIEIKEPDLPSLTPYESAAIRQKIPPQKNGVIEIATMKGKAAIGPLASGIRYKTQKILQKSKKPEAIFIRTGHYTLNSLAKELGKPALIENTPSAYIIRTPIAVHPHASLTIADLDKPVYLSQEKGAFIASAGNLFILNTTMKGWSEKNNAPAELNEDHKNFRPFITVWDGGELYIAGSTISHMGYDETKSYGITLTKDPGVEERFFYSHGRMSPPKGWIIDSSFTDLFKGFYTRQAQNIALINNRYKDMIENAINPQDHTSSVIIARNHISGTKNGDGIAVSNNTTNTFIFNNISEHNKGNGIALNQKCQSNVIANNMLRFNDQSGLSFSKSPNNSAFNNIITNNQQGITLKNSYGITIYGGNIAMNKKQAITLRQSSNNTTTALFSAITLESNGEIMKTDGFTDLRFSNMNWQNGSLSPKAFSGPLSEHSHKLLQLPRNSIIKLIRTAP